MSGSHAKKAPIELDPPLLSQAGGLIADPDRVILRKRTILVLLAAVVGTSLVLAPVTGSSAVTDAGSETGVQAAIHGEVKPVSLAGEFESPSVPVVVAVTDSFDKRAQVISASMDAVEIEPNRVEAAGSGEVEAVSASSVWDRLADCESGDWDSSGQPIAGSARWDYGISFSHGDSFEGGLNFASSTWDSFRDADMPSHAGEATRAQQITVGERVLDAQGWGAWPACSSKLGLR